jgi:DNA mismatch repair protein MutL
VYDSARPKGTRIKVSNLFFNLPVRAKFLKSASWERRLIIELVKTYAVVCPGVAFVVAASGKEVLNLQAARSMEQRAKLLLPRPIADLLLTVEFQLGQARVSGVLARPGQSMKQKMSYIYVNSRPVKYPRLFRTIMDAYENPQTIPAFALNIQVLPESVDVNMHPAKSEVKFKDERYIMDLLQQVIKREVFKKSVSIEYDTVRRVTTKTEPKPGRFVQDLVAGYDEQERVEPASGSEEFWQLHNTYILAQTKSGLIIVDQHVAHERVIYESIMKGRVQSQRLLFPITIELTPEEHDVYEKTKHTLKDMGIEFKEFSAHTVVIDSLPSGVRTNREEIAGLFKELNDLGDLAKEKSRIATVVACRGAIKAGQKLSPAEMRALIDHLFATENPYTCPHGRPIVIRLTNEELARKFGRSLPVAH